MILSISSAEPRFLELALSDGEVTLSHAQIPAERRQAELLLPQIAKLLQTSSLHLSDITAVQVVTEGAGFSSLRIGVATANALAFALGVPVMPLQGKALKKKGILVAAPAYSRPPSIGKKE